MRLPVPIAALLCLAACVEYGLAEPEPEVQPPPPPPVEGPRIEVDPTEVSLDGVCGEEGTVVEIRSVGTEPLQVAGLYMDAVGWQVSSQPLPVILDPGASMWVELLTGGGSGTVVVDSNDPQRPSVGIPLLGANDEPPSFGLMYPISGTTLPLDDATLRALVSDDVDPPQALTVMWSSDRDGVIGTAPPAPDGIAEALWPAPRTVGDHLLTLTATDTCGGAASLTIPLCQGTGHTEDDIDVDSWTLSGAARWDEVNDWLELTPVANFVVGAAFDLDHPVRGDAVALELDFYIGDGSGADGISVTALDSDRATSFLGGDGCGIGYGGHADCTGGPALPGWSIEVDTWFNAGVDPTEADHVAFTFDGDVDGPAAWATLPEMEDTGWHHMSVDVRAPRVVVAIDGAVVLNEDLDGYFDFPAYVGFTAGTGGSTNAHLIDGLQVTDQLCE